jgi:hypothetical protein
MCLLERKIKLLFDPMAAKRTAWKLLTLFSLCEQQGALLTYMPLLLGFTFVPGSVPSKEPGKTGGQPGTGVIGEPLLP